MDWANTLKSTAGSCLFREQWDAALEKVEEAKGVVSELSQVANRKKEEKEKGEKKEKRNTPKIQNAQTKLLTYRR